MIATTPRPWIVAVTLTTLMTATFKRIISSLAVSAHASHSSNARDSDDVVRFRRLANTTYRGIDLSARSRRARGAG
jgi:hypothetical protein